LPFRFHNDKSSISSRDDSEFRGFSFDGHIENAIAYAYGIPAADLDHVGVDPAIVDANVEPSARNECDVYRYLSVFQADIISHRPETLPRLLAQDKRGRVENTVRWRDVLAA
jgi:hypothetical protein